MGIASAPLPVKLMFAITYDPLVDLKQVLSLLDSRFGIPEYSYGPVPFSWTSYYADEMGENLMKYYFNYPSFIDRAEITSLKLYTNRLEKEFMVDGRRRVNIDPGYISRDKLVLATTKDFYHRLYLGDGIYGEVTLHYRKGKYRIFSWTYPDFREPLLHAFLERARAKLVKGIRDDQE
ncbi:MAG: DUF4416 family protein [Fibrobacter sp.]|nr:DUF4416 family protein [Fibrobacter sp.]